MSGFSIDIAQLRTVQAAVGATESQFIAAYHKALKQTTARLYKASTTLMLSTLGAKGKQVTQRRVRAFVSKVSRDKPGGGKIWFGLNDIPVSTLKGSMRNPRKVKRRRDEKGRFVKSKGARGATFIPKSSSLSPSSFPNSFVATVKDKRSIYIRQANGFLTEAREPVYDPMVGAIGADIFPQAGEMLLDYFTKDINGRVAGNVHLNSKGKRA